MNGSGGGAAAGGPAEPVGLGPRAAAFALDYVPMAAYLALLTAVGAGLGWAFPEAVARAFGQAARAQAIGFVLVTLPVGLYFVVWEASGRQATWGKRRLGLDVVGPAGARLGMGRSLARTAIKFVPWELAHAAVWGVALAGGEPAPVHLALLALVWTLVGANVVGIGLGRRGLYDVLVGTRVVRGGRLGACGVSKHVHRSC